MRSLFNKIDELQSLLTTLTPLPIFVSMCKTWCKPDDPDSLYTIPNYSLFRGNRLGRTGGGVAMYILETAMSACERLTDLEDEGQEALWVTMLLENNNRPFTIGCVYRPPDLDSSILASSLEQSLKNIQQHSSTVILTGDLNARCREWFVPDRTDFCGEKNRGVIPHILFRTEGI